MRMASPAITPKPTSLQADRASSPLPPRSPGLGAVTTRPGFSAASPRPPAKRWARPGVRRWAHFTTASPRGADETRRAARSATSPKSLATTADQSDEFASLAKINGRVLLVDFNRRYAECYQAARAAFGDNRPQIVVAQKNRPGSEYRASFENAIHMVDLLRYFCGEPVAVTASAVCPEDRYHEAGLTAHIDFDSGSSGVLIAAREAGGWDERLEAHGGMRTARVSAPNRWSIAEDGVETTHDAVRSTYGWSTATETVRLRIGCSRLHLMCTGTHHPTVRRGKRRPNPETAGTDPRAGRAAPRRSAGLPVGKPRAEIGSSPQVGDGRDRAACRRNPARTEHSRSPHQRVARAHPGPQQLTLWPDRRAEQPHLSEATMSVYLSIVPTLEEPPP